MWGDSMENKHEEHMQVIPYVVYRDSLAHNRWLVKGLVIALVIAIILMFASNAIWAYIWYQYDTVTEETVTTVDSEGEGTASYIGGDIDANGGVVIGEGNSAQDSQDTD